MFNKKESPRQPLKGENEAISSIIAKDMCLTGEIQFKGKARLDGIVNGNIKGEYLIISESGRINGDLVVDTLICHGSVMGNTKAGFVTAHATSFIQGKLETTSLTVESGASLDGEIKTTNQAMRSAHTSGSLPAPPTRELPENTPGN